MTDEYVTKLERIVKQMLCPLKEVPITLVMESISGHKIIPFNPQEKEDEELLQDLKDAAESTGRELQRKPIQRERPNEVGNDIEAYVKEALRKKGYKAETPASSSGRKKGAGYPDIELVDSHGRTTYLECKTFNAKNIGTTQRTFYFSPSTDFKVTQDAHHLLISFEIFISDRNGRENIYKCRQWKILDLYHLDVDVKYEFNSNNRRLYATKMILAEGKI
jgi:hypothetical protein